MTKSEEYRERAGTCVEAAQVVGDRRLKLTLLEMAQQWMGLAHITERAAGPIRTSRKEDVDQDKT